MMSSGKCSKRSHGPKQTQQWLLRSDERAAHVVMFWKQMFISEIHRSPVSVKQKYGALMKRWYIIEYIEGSQHSATYFIMVLIS